MVYQKIYGERLRSKALLQKNQILLGTFPDFRTPAPTNNFKPFVNRSFSLAGSKRAPLDYAPYQKIRNDPAIIYGRKYTGDALDRMQDRGLMPSVIENAIQKNIVMPNKVMGRMQFYDGINNISVVTENGEVVTILHGRLK